jgi:hypothetical protein
VSRGSAAYHGAALIYVVHRLSVSYRTLVNPPNGPCKRRGSKLEAITKVSSNLPVICREWKQKGRVLGHMDARDRYLASQRRYNASQKGWERRRRYEQTAKAIRRKIDFDKRRDRDTYWQEDRLAERERYEAAVATCRSSIG